MHVKETRVIFPFLVGCSMCELSKTKCTAICQIAVLGTSLKFAYMSELFEPALIPTAIEVSNLVFAPLDTSA